MRFVDTNVFIRFLTEDIPEKADACEELFKKALADKERLFTTELVIAEIIWVLEFYYELPKNEVQEKVEKILNTSNLVCPQKEVILGALNLYNQFYLQLRDRIRQLKINWIGDQYREARVFSFSLDYLYLFLPYRDVGIYNTQADMKRLFYPRHPYN